MRRVLIAVLLLVPGCGDDEPKAGREVRIETTKELRFSPAEVTSRAGETVTFVVVNTSLIDHELAIGDAAFQAGHDSGGHGGHDAEGGKAVDVKPGETARLTFTMPDTPPTFACHVDDHDSAGMKGTVVYE